MFRNLRAWFRLRKAKKKLDFFNSRRAVQGADWGKVLPNIYIGNLIAASDESFLRLHKITHVVEAARGVNNNFSGITYLRLDLLDDMSENIERTFPAVTHFINSAVSRGENVFVHCFAGVSRSVSVLMAYIIATQRATAESALRIVRVGRPIAKPNPSFGQQLVRWQYKWDEEMKKYYSRGATKIS